MSDLTISPAGFVFLQELAANNTRAWFDPRRTEFERLLVDPLVAILDAASARLTDGPWPVSGGRRTIFRQLRDQRWAKEVPYATSVRALLTSTGTKPAREGCVHVEIAPDGGFVGVGFHRPPATMLAPIRQRMVDEPERWRAIVDALDRSELDLADDRLERMPRGFTGLSEHALADDLRRRSLTVSVPLGIDTWTSDAALDVIVDTVTAGMPLLRFGNDAAGFAPHPEADPAD
ncbi:MAG: DUF2461 domain-containing protein [Actinomycetota bacterium]